MERPALRREGEGEIGGLGCPGPLHPGGGLPRHWPRRPVPDGLSGQQGTADALDALRLKEGTALRLGPEVYGKRPLTSVAVVMTGTAPQTSASARASAFAPPRWPDNRGTANCPPSSTATTAGSLALLLQ